MPAKSSAALKDTQNEPDHRKIAIDRVGVKSLRYPIQVRDRASGQLQSTVGVFTLTVDLPHHFKGTHMSRFIEVLNAHGPVFQVDNIHAMLGRLLNRLDSEEAHIILEFPFFLEKAAPVSGSKGLLDYGVRFEAGAKRKGDFDFIITVTVPVTTLCPCSKSISKYGAHNQRGHVNLAVRFHKHIWIEELIRLVENCASSELYSLLKRPDEKFVTEHAFENPVFVEDLVRAVASQARAHPEITWFRVEAENFESIHNHNAYAMVEGRGYTATA
jgi:GTP cyclohydrolase IB